MKNVGCVVYTETKTGIEAEWVFSENGKITSGTGVGIRLTELKSERRFEGEYEITYYDRNGLKSPKLILIVSFEFESYKLEWADNGKVTDIGVGIASSNTLSSGYRQWKKA